MPGDSYGPSGPADEGASGGERVLIVEDDPTTRSGLQELVASWG